MTGLVLRTVFVPDDNGFVHVRTFIVAVAGVQTEPSLERLPSGNLAHCVGIGGV